MPFQNPVIVVPGITATDLVDDYPLSGDKLWSMVLNRQYERVALHPDDLRYEAVEPAHVVPGQLFPIYNDLVRALRFELSESADRPTPVFAFPYDWRINIASVAEALASFIDEVIARTKLLRHYDGADNLKVDLVGHSMGGLVICEYLAKYKGRSRVGKVATLGTPYGGSVEAIVKIATGMSLITGPEPKEREREAARVTPSLYHLLPSYDKAVINERGNALDVFNPRNMQQSVLQSLAEFVRLYSVGVKKKDRVGRAKSILRDMLSEAKGHRKRIDEFRPSHARIPRSNWLCIAGVGEQTRLQMTVRRPHGQPRFEVNEEQFVNEFAQDPRSQRTGDGTVPLAGALPKFLPRSAVVCVRDNDLGRFEIRDRVLTEFAGLHGLLPRVNLVQRLVMRHLKPSYSGRVWGRKVPGNRSWNPPIAGLEDRSAQAASRLSIVASRR